MRLANADTERLGRVDAGVHAGDEDEVVGRRRGQAPVLEAGGVALRGGGDVLPEGRHGGGRRVGRQGSGWRGIIVRRFRGRGRRGCEV